PETTLQHPKSRLVSRLSQARQETKGRQRVGDDGLYHRGSRAAPPPLSRPDPILHPRRFPLPRTRRARGAAVFLSGPGAAARRKGLDGGPNPRGEDPRLAAPAEAAAAAEIGRASCRERV